ncbi:PREDICTED: omega-conotoxin-like protein 1 [Vollenhovia emeryi]|uniref:omega-conotoxin-like protein 1 n=1 Tax=Vollenhovia emeryi TaxID=411798 RepID=UPI0005F49DE7|nr:PREDICTED: omega-conotoxin-like protein 1 [Vollenhovia emeryi]
MAKILLCVFVALLTVSLIMGATDKPANCGRHGDPCIYDLQCCANIKCNRYANRCQVQITAEELMAQRKKILGRDGPDY